MTACGVTLSFLLEMFDLLWKTMTQYFSIILLYLNNFMASKILGF
jgi:hypothetical protein